uniref:Bowman-Birk type proteinase inhibitor B7 n=1 Tax=Hyacinthus orientalis TaxID=82025 RepID=IBBB7_HYAOR|nr:RecName: Full=Bowman-Birk type proteinase inhibitor B7; Short=HOSPI-B7 [Hyacinthus orientalis]
GEGACCNNCDFICGRAGFSRCRCLDLVTKCHPSCSNCEMTETPYWPCRYQCLDMDPDDCATP